ncbi:MAG: alpha/beta hydrolase [Dehalococcoidia bacterium]|nr:alpha/beta hydrolase [Dehalococcoidia bacterium]
MVTAGYLERSVKVGNLKLSYQEWGNPQAQPIIMLHGFGVSGHMFDEFAGRMQDRYRLIALDQRGHGDSDWAEDGDYTRTAFVEDLEGFRHELGIDRFILMGHSMGGLNSVTYTNRYPQHVSALVLVDVGPESAKEGVDNIVRFTRGPDELEFEEFVELAHRFNQRRTLENIRERMRHRLKPTETGKYTWKFDKRFRQPDSGLRIGGEAANDDSWALFRGVRVPALLIRGSESDVLSQEVAERAASEMPRARLIVIPGAGHSVPGDSPDAFTDGVREFLGDLEHGEFEPAAAAPPLERLMEEHTAASRRGSSLILLAAAGAAAVLIIAGQASQPADRARNGPPLAPRPLNGGPSEAVLPQPRDGFPFIRPMSSMRVNAPRKSLHGSVSPGQKDHAGRVSRSRRLTWIMPGWRHRTRWPF